MIQDRNWKNIDSNLKEKVIFTIQIIFTNDTVIYFLISKVLVCKFLNVFHSAIAIKIISFPSLELAQFLLDNSLPVLLLDALYLSEIYPEIKMNLNDSSLNNSFRKFDDSFRKFVDSFRYFDGSIKILMFHSKNTTNRLQKFWRFLWTIWRFIYQILRFIQQIWQII